MLRRKVVIQVLAIMAASLSLFIFAYFLILQNYRSLERETLSSDQQRVLNALAREIDSLHQTTYEWASTEFFYALTQPPLVNTNAIHAIMEAIAGTYNITHAAAYNDQAALISARGLAGGENAAALPETDAFLQLIEDNPTLKVHDGAQTSISGLALIDGTTYLVASQPILAGPEAVASSGALVLAAELAREDLDRLSETVRQTLEVVPLEDFAVQADNAGLASSLLADPGGLLSIPRGSNQMDTYRLFADYNGDYNFVLKTTAEREVMRQAVRSMVINGLLLLAAFLLLALYILYFFDKNILQRLQEIGGTVARMREGGGLGARLLVSGKDEISEFSHAFNRALDSLEQAHATLRSEKEKAVTTLASIGDAVITTDADARIVYMNPAAEKYTHCALEKAAGRPLHDVFRPSDKEGKQAGKSLARQCLDAGSEISDARYCYLHKDSSDEMAIESRTSPIRSESGPPEGAVVVFRDVTLAKNLQRTLSYQATHDALTNLYNRREFERRLRLVTLETRKSDKNHKLLYIDLDRFKIVNDACGHVAGDKVLAELAALMNEHIRRSDVLARIGGDEFAIILMDCAMADAMRIADSVRESIGAFRFQSQGQYFSFGASIGLLDLQQLPAQQRENALAIADAACMAAKNTGRDKIHVYKPEDNDEALQQQNLWISHVTRALEEDRFVLFFQKIFDFAGGDQRVGGIEILLRMETDDGELASPGLFIPAAERYGMMKRIDRLVIEKLERAVANHPGATRDMGLFFVNLSGQSLSDDDFLAFLVDFLDAHQALTQHLCFEITETAVIHSLANARKFITRVKEQGCRFALDDFGSGLSSFGYLKQLPVDLLKIDGSFVRTMDKSSVDKAMVRSINDIGHVHGLQTIAEFIENEEILAIARDIGVDFAQGYHLHKPEALDNLLTAKRDTENNR